MKNEKKSAKKKPVCDDCDFKNKVKAYFRKNRGLPDPNVSIKPCNHDYKDDQEREKIMMFITWQDRFSDMLAKKLKKVKVDKK